jgi:hypothetical protein
LTWHARGDSQVKQFKLAWFHKLAGNARYSLRVPDAAKCFLEHETLKHAQFLCTIAVINLRVHTDRYNEMLNKILGVDRGVGGGGASVNSAADTLEAKYGVGGSPH